MHRTQGSASARRPAKRGVGPGTLRCRGRHPKRGQPHTKHLRKQAVYRARPCRMTRDEARKSNCGAPGQVFHASLRTDEEKRFRCRLCVVDADEGGWKQARHALRHVNRDHFGLGARNLLSPLISILWSRYRIEGSRAVRGVVRTAYTAGELTRHRGAASAHQAGTH
jgi:hypothetical protein